MALQRGRRRSAFLRRPGAARRKQNWGRREEGIKQQPQHATLKVNVRTCPLRAQWEEDRLDSAPWRSLVRARSRRWAPAPWAGDRQAEARRRRGIWHVPLPPRRLLLLCDHVIIQSNEWAELHQPPPLLQKVLAGGRVCDGLLPELRLRARVEDPLVPILARRAEEHEQALVVAAARRRETLQGVHEQRGNFWRAEGGDQERAVVCYSLHRPQNER